MSDSEDYDYGSDSEPSLMSEDEEEPSEEAGVEEDFGLDQTVSTIKRVGDLSSNFSPASFCNCLLQPLRPCCAGSL